MKSLRRIHKQLSLREEKPGTSTTLARSSMKLHLMAAFNKLYILAKNSVVCIICLIALNYVAAKKKNLEKQSFEFGIMTHKYLSSTKQNEL